MPLVPPEASGLEAPLAKQKPLLEKEGVFLYQNFTAMHFLYIIYSSSTDKISRWGELVH